MICKECGAKVIDKYAKFCSRCGKPLNNNINDKFKNIREKVDKNVYNRLEYKKLNKNSSLFYGDKGFIKGRIMTIEENNGEGEIYADCCPPLFKEFYVLYSGTYDVYEDDDIIVYGHVIEDYRDSPCIKATLIEKIDENLRERCMKYRRK